MIKILLLLLPLLSFADDKPDYKSYWKLKVDHYNVVYLQCGPYSYSTSEIIYHDVGIVDKIVISTHTDYVKSPYWMSKHINLNGTECK